MNDEEQVAGLVRQSPTELHPGPADGGTRGASRRRARMAGLAGVTAVAVAVTAIVAGFEVFGPQPGHGPEPGVAATTATAAPTTADVPRWVAACIQGGARAVQYLGLPMSDAVTRARTHDTTMVVVGMDGRCIPIVAVTLYHPLFVATEDARVVEARYQGWPGPPN